MHKCICNIRKSKREINRRNIQITNGQEVLTLRRPPIPNPESSEDNRIKHHQSYTEAWCIQTEENLTEINTQRRPQ